MAMSRGLANGTPVSCPCHRESQPARENRGRAMPSARRRSADGSTPPSSRQRTISTKPPLGPRYRPVRPTTFSCGRTLNIQNRGGLRTGKWARASRCACREAIRLGEREARTAKQPQGPAPARIRQFVSNKLFPINRRYCEYYAAETRGRRHPASPRHCYLTMIMKPFGLTERTMLPSTTFAPCAHSGLSTRFTVLPEKSIPLVSA